MPSTKPLFNVEANRDRLIANIEKLRAERDTLVLSLLPHTTTAKSPTQDTNNPADFVSTATQSPTTDEITSTIALARATAREHISLLHGYNEIKDITQMLMGLLAEQRGVRVVEIMEEFGMDPKD